MSVFPLKRPQIGEVHKQFIATAYWGDYTVGLKSNGTCIATRGCSLNISDWTNIIAIDTKGPHIVGLKADGTCVATGANGWGQCNISNWTDIVSVKTGYNFTVGLKSDGTCVLSNDTRNDVSITAINTWKDIVAIYTSDYWIIGLKADGTCVWMGRNNNNDYLNLSSWKDIVSVDLHNYNGAVGLKSDGTCVGNLNRTGCNVSSWKGIVSVAVGNAHIVGLKADGTCVAVASRDAFGETKVTSWNDIIAISADTNYTVGLKSNGTCVATGDNRNGQCDVTNWKLATYSKKGLLIAKEPINLLDKTSINGITFEGIEPANTSRHIVFKVDDTWNKLTGDGNLEPLTTQDIDKDSVIAEGNTIAEVEALTDIPAFVGKLIYPAIALYASEKAEVMPTFGMTVNAEIDTTVDVYTKTAYSQEFVLHNKRDVLVKSISVDSNTKGNGKITLKARYATFDETASTEEGAGLTEKWSDYVDLLSVINVKCHKLQIKADYQVSITDGSDSATLNDVVITYAKDVVAKADGTTDLVTLTEKFTNDLTYVHAYIKHKELIDADLKAYVRLQKTPQKADFKLIGYGTGARKTYKVTDSGINQDSLMVYVNGKVVYDFDFNTETSEITLVADVDVPINATYEFGWELFNYVEMQKGVSQINDSGAYTTEYSYTIPAHDGEYTVTAIKYELIRPEGKATNEVIGVGTGKRQIIQLPHFARKETIQCNGKWSYDYDSKRLTVIAPADTDIVISYDWIAESPQVYGVMAGWAD